MKTWHKITYVLFNSKAGFATEEELRKVKIAAFARRAGVSEQVAEFMMLRRRVHAKLNGVTDWRQYYD